MLDLYVVLKGPDHVAHNVNKALYLIFERFNMYFYQTVDQLDKEAYASFKAMSPAEQPGAAATQKKLRDVATEVMEEFNARERRIYTQEAFRTRNMVKENITLKRGMDMRLHALAMFRYFSVKASAIRNFREMLKNLRMKLLDICDQSLMGFQQMIESYKIHSGLRPLPRSMANEFHVNPVGKRYTLDDQDNFSELAEETKEETVLKYFVKEMHIRLSNPRIENLSTYVVNLLGRIQVETGKKDPQTVARFKVEMDGKFGAKRL